MQANFVRDKIYDKTDIVKKILLAKGEYENCRFTNSDFSNADLSEIKFIDCEFSACNLSLAKLNRTAFKDITLTNDCKMLGLQFSHCYEFGLSFAFKNCVLTHCSFYQTKIKKTTLANCKNYAGVLILFLISATKELH